MTYELRSISPSRLARLMAWVLGAFFLFFSVIGLPIFLLAPFPEGVKGQPPKALFVAMLVFYPVFGAIWGWICGQISARIYNFVARKAGGVIFEASKLEGGQV